MEGRLSRRILGVLKAGLGRLFALPITDPRQRLNRRWSLRQLLTAVLAGICAGCHNLAQVEALTLFLAAAGRKVLGLGRRVPDTTMRDLLVKASPNVMRGMLWHQVRQAHRQKALQPVALPIPAVGLDGKATALRSWEAGYAQRQLHGGSAKGASGLLRTFTCTLLSGLVPVCIDAAPIPPQTNEDGHFTKVVDRLLKLFAHLDLFRLVVADAGSCSLANASHLRRRNLHYLFTLNDKQPTLLAEAQRLLGQLPVADALARTSERIRGGIEQRVLFLTTEMASFLSWTHLVTVLRVQRTRWDKDGHIEFVHHRYFVCSLRAEAMKPDQWLFLIRRYWACVESGCHNRLDTTFQEDEHPWITAHDKGMLNRGGLRSAQSSEVDGGPAGPAVNVLILRRIAYNLVALFRGVTQRSEDRRLTPWATVLQWFYIALIAATAQDAKGLRPRAESSGTR